MKKFLGILSLNPECDIDFQENYMLIKFGRSKIKYSYSEISTICIETFRLLTIAEGLGGHNMLASGLVK